MVYNGHEMEVIFMNINLSSKNELVIKNEYSYLLDDIRKYRQDLHRIPELGFLVYKTGAYVKEILSKLECKIEPLVNTGFAVFFDFGCEESLCFRCDMDGLPIEEQTVAFYASEHEGCMHACGHDGHMANMLGFAHVLDKYIKERKELPYNALLIFQPAEETIDGAEAIVKTTVFEDYNVKAIYGLHLWPMIEKGEIASKPGAMMARSTNVKVIFEGKSAHAGEPDKGRDALLAACEFVTKIYDYKDNFIRERSILQFGKMESGNVRNAISPYTSLDGTMRTFNDLTWAKIVNAMRNIADDIEQNIGVKVDVDVSQWHPAVVNDTTLYSKIKYALKNLDFVELRRPVMIAEDFSCFEQVLPGVFFFLGTGTGIPLHNDHFDFEEDVLLNGIKLFDTLLKTQLSTCSVDISS